MYVSDQPDCDLIIIKRVYCSANSSEIPQSTRVMKLGVPNYKASYQAEARSSCAATPHPKKKRLLAQGARAEGNVVDEIFCSGLLRRKTEYNFRTGVSCSMGKKGTPTGKVPMTTDEREAERDRRIKVRLASRERGGERERER
jgi:hypothetical protein